MNKKNILILSCILISSSLIIGCNKKADKPMTAQQLINERNIISIEQKYKELYFDKDFKINEIVNFENNIILHDGFEYNVKSVKILNDNSTDKLDDNNYIIEVDLSITNKGDKPFVGYPYILRLIDNDKIIKPLFDKEITDNINQLETKDYILKFEVQNKSKTYKIGLNEKFDNKDFFYLSKDIEVINYEE